MAELQGYGRTAECGRPLCATWMAEDVTTLAGHLTLEMADIMAQRPVGIDTAWINRKEAGRVFGAVVDLSAVSGNG